MDGFIAHLGAVRDQSRKWDDEDDVNWPEHYFYHIAISSLKNAIQYTRKSLGNWEQAHKLAKEARRLLTRPAQKPTQANAESRGLEGLQLLSER